MPSLLPIKVSDLRHVELHGRPQSVDDAGRVEEEGQRLIALFLLILLGQRDHAYFASGVRQWSCHEVVANSEREYLSIFCPHAAQPCQDHRLDAARPMLL